MLKRSEEVASRILEIFPDFKKYWDEGEGYGYQDGEYNIHSIFLTFGPVSKMLIESASETQIKDFCGFVNKLVAEGDELENAVSTCFLEHASQLGVRKFIRRYLSAEARNELR